MTGRVETEVPTSLTRPTDRTHNEVTVPYSSFLVSSSEKEAAEQIKQLIFNYFVLKLACSINDRYLIDMKTFCGLSLQNIPSVQPSNVVYLSINDMHADTREAMEAVVAKLHSEYQIGIAANSLVVVGDQKTYSRIKELKQIYAQDLKWLIPFIGDWHLLHNFHSVLMTVYYDAGLKDLAQASGFRGETLTSLKRCSNFKRVHHFLLQSWEALYRHMLHTYTTEQDKEFFGDLLSAACAKIRECSKMCKNENSSVPLQRYLLEFQTQNPDFLTKFFEWVSRLADKYPNWKFWKNFVFRDIFSYVSLFLSIRGGMWNLRLFAIKQIAPFSLA